MVRDCIYTAICPLMLAESVVLKLVYLKTQRLLRKINRESNLLFNTAVYFIHFLDKDCQPLLSIILHLKSYYFFIATGNFLSRQISKTMSTNHLVSVSLFNGISTLFRLFNAKAILLEEQYYLTHSWEDKGVHTFPKGICPKVNVIAQLENELAYYDSTVHRFNHYTTRTTPYHLDFFC